MGPKEFRLDLIGPFGLFTRDGQRINITSRKSAALIALLAVSPNGVRTREWLWQMLWGDRERDQARASLRRELSNLSSILRKADAERLLIKETQRISVNIEIIKVDVFSIGVEPAQHPAFFNGDFLEGFDLPGCEEFEDWLREERSRIYDLIENAAKGDSTHNSGRLAEKGTHIPANQGVDRNAPPKPSVAIMTFLESGVREDSKWLSPAIADSLNKLLCQFPQLFVKSSISVRRLQGQGMGALEIAKKLNLKYIVDGDWSLHNDQLRMSTSLIDGANGEQVWSENFVARISDIHAIQLQIAQQIAPRIWTFVDQTERTKVLRQNVQSLQDYERYWRANALFREFRNESMSEAISLLHELTEKNPECPWATSLAGFCHGLAYILRMTPDHEGARRRAINFCQIAQQRGYDNAEALGYCAGTLLVIGGDIERADSMIRHAIDLMPSFQPILFWGGWIDIGRGDTERARERFSLALEINPETGARGQTLCGIGISMLLDGDPATALEYFTEAAVTAQNFPINLLGLAIAGHQTGNNEIVENVMPVIREFDSEGLIQLFRRKRDREVFAQALSTERMNTGRKHRNTGY